MEQLTQLASNHPVAAVCAIGMMIMLIVYLIHAATELCVTAVKTFIVLVRGYPPAHCDALGNHRNDLEEYW